MSHSKYQSSTVIHSRFFGTLSWSMAERTALTCSFISSRMWGRGAISTRIAQYNNWKFGSHSCADRPIFWTQVQSFTMVDESWEISRTHKGSKAKCHFTKKQTNKNQVAAVGKINLSAQPDAISVSVLSAKWMG